MVLAEIHRDLFQSSEGTALAQCISLDCCIGARIACEFKALFPALMYNWLQKGNMGEVVTVVSK